MNPGDSRVSSYESTQGADVSPAFYKDPELASPILNPISRWDTWPTAELDAPSFDLKNPSKP
jgi:hypothetical protein